MNETFPQSHGPAGTLAATTVMPSTLYDTDYPSQVRNGRNRKVQKNKRAPTDGAVSDSAAMTLSSPQSKKTVAQTRPQPQHSSIHSSSKKLRSVVNNTHVAPATPAKEQAYAGSTFQASPAASALPLPKLFSRPLSGHGNLPSSRPDTSRSLELKPSPTESNLILSASPPSRKAQQSPLDVFFEADRVEKTSHRVQHSPLAPRITPAPRPISATSARTLPFDAGIVSAQQPVNVATSDRPSLSRSSTHSFTGRFPPLEPDQDPHVPVVLPYHRSDNPSGSLKDFLADTTTTPASAFTPPRPNSISHESFPVSFGQQKTPGQQHNASLHYGNRNLSPMFQAARGNVRTASSPYSSPEHTSYNDATSASPSRLAGPMDPNAFSRIFLNQHISSAQAPAQAGPPDFRATSGFVTDRHMAAVTGSHDMGAPPYPRHLPAQTVQRNTANHDVRSMEDDLRRMLNLNVLSK